MVAMHTAYMVADGGGGTVDYSTLLSMKEVLDETTEQTTRVLYAETIDVEAASTIIDTLGAITDEGGVGPSTSILIGENEEMMAATNSDRFYTGTDAQAQFAAMNQVNDKLSKLISNIDTIYNNKATIISNIEEYNTKLKELKKDCRIKLLREAADKWNLEKHIEKTVHVYASTAYPIKNTVWGDSQYIYDEPINIQTHTSIPVSEYDTGISYEYDRVYYKIIKYWKGLKNLSWFRDPGFADVEKLFTEVGAPLPYDPNLILPKE